MRALQGAYCSRAVQDLHLAAAFGIVVAAILHNACAFLKALFQVSAWFNWEPIFHFHNILSQRQKILDISYYSACLFPQGLSATSDSFLIAAFPRPAMPQVSSSKLLYFKSPAVTVFISNIPTGRPPSRWVILISKGVVLRPLRGRCSSSCFVLA